MITKPLEVSVGKHSTHYLATLPWAVAKLHCERSYDIPLITTLDVASSDKKEKEHPFP